MAALQLRERVKKWECANGKDMSIYPRLHNSTTVPGSSLPRAARAADLRSQQNHGVLIQFGLAGAMCAA